MKSPYGIDIFDNCSACPVREQHSFCNLSASAVQRLSEITSTGIYPRGATLFIEGQLARGIFVLCSGKAKLFTSSRLGKTIITTISEHGDVLGLNATISHRLYEVTAQMVEPGQANFIAAEALLQFLNDYREVAFHIVKEASLGYYTAHEEIRTLGLTTSPRAKLAKLLLAWSMQAEDLSNSPQLRLVLTHEEVAEMIGTTRETVTRLFSDFKMRQFIDCTGTRLVVLNRPALERLVQA